ncbi:multidrug effflux MFS transporter [Aestuariispira ectoiniformans]|uniref:multidrug effflux MFS transporter n=1 Tax=Aestuariispira ectoiniformans TaxID=2775080 RepID=UPI00223BF1C7|nr:multidrug effflux MFS transporter [Aestuariispira ectoiniformans]
MGNGQNQHRGLLAVLLTMLAALGPISTDLYLPALPSIEKAFETDVATVQLTLSVYMVAFAVCQLFYGAMSDRFGRKPVLAFGVTVYFVASVACALATSIEGLVAARFCQALGGCCGVVVGRAVVRDVFGRKKSAKILSYMGTAMALAPALGPVIGGYLTVAFGWVASFWVLSGFGGACLLGVLFVLRESNADPDHTALRPRQMAANFAQLIKHRSFFGFLLVSAFSYGGLFAYISGSSFVFIQVIGLSADQYGYCFAAIVIGYMVGTQIGGRTVHRHGERRLVHRGAIVSALSGIAMAGFAYIGVLNVAVILLPMVTYMVGMGLVLPNAAAAGIGPFPRMAGAASSLIGFCQYGFAALVGLAVGHAFNQTQFPMVTMICAMGVGTYLFYRFVVHAAPADAEEAAA